MKNLEQLEQEGISNAIVQLSCVAKEMTLQMQNLSQNLIEASAQMRQLQATLICTSSKEVSGDGSGEALPEVSQEQRDSDGWRVWNGGAKALTRKNVQVKFRNGQDAFGKVLDWNWYHNGGEWDIIAYRIVK